MVAEEAAEDTDERGRFKASDLLKAAGLTYRQLHEWERRAGIAPSERAAEEGWRRFTWEEVLALCVSSGLRRKFSLPLEDIGRLYLWLVGRKPDKVHTTLADVAEMQLKSMQADERTASLLALRGVALTEALKDRLNQYVFQEFIRCKLNSLARHPLVLAYRLADMGVPVYLCTTLQSSLILQERNLVRWVAQRFADAPVIVYPLNDTINEFRKSLNLPPTKLDHIFPSFKAGGCPARC
jgi:DNA-binding transcriptional MerR regulator